MTAAAYTTSNKSFQSLNLVPKIEGYMVELRGYAHEIQDLIGMKAPSGKNSADEIDEDHWLNVVIKGLNEICIRCAKELEKETGTYPKITPDYPNGQPLEKAPPTRLLPF